MDLVATARSNPIWEKKPHTADGHSTVSYSHRRTGSDETYYTKYGRIRPGGKRKNSLSSQIRLNTVAYPPPPYHLIASLFLDGREKAERQAIIYLDPFNEDFSHPEGKIKLQSRWVQGADGNMKEIFWVFKDVGIETAFDQMLIDSGRDGSNHGNLDEQDEDAVIAAMNATALGAEEGVNRDEKRSIGQILIVIRRIIVGPKWLESRYHPPHKEGDADEIDMSGMTNEISHTTG